MGSAPNRRISMALGFVAVVAALWLGKAFLVPLALAGLATLLLAPFVEWLHRQLKCPRVLGTLLVMGMTTLLVFGVVALVVTQVLDLAKELPAYRDNIQAKLDSVRGMTGQIGEMGDTLERVKETVDGGDEGTEEPGAASGEQKPAPPERVVVAEPAPQGRFGALKRYLGPLLGPLGTGAMVMVLTLFLLLGRLSLRDRILHVAGGGEATITAQALDEASGRVSRYLLATLGVNALYGVPLALGLWFIGVPNAFLFGLIGVVLRFIPYLGPWTAGLLPLALSFAVFPDWQPVLMVLGLIVVLEILNANVVEPILYGHQVGLSPLAVVVSAFFWSWLWGIPGLVLAVPITACLSVAGRYIPGMSAFHILLSSKPDLGYHNRYYHRLLCFDAEGASHVARQEIERQGATAFIDQIIFPTLYVAECERQSGDLSTRHHAFIREAIRDLLDELGPADADVETLRRAGPSLVLPAGRPGEELAGHALKRVLAHDGMESKVAPAGTLVSEALARADTDAARTLILLVMAPELAERALHRVKRVRARFADRRLIVLLCGHRVDLDDLEDRLRSAGADHVVWTSSACAQAVRGSRDAPVPAASTA